MSLIDKNAVDNFFAEVLKDLLPKGRHQSASFFGPADIERATNIRLDLAESNEINIASDYFYNKTYSFIHYTSISSLLNILKKKKIRLYNLYGMDDKEEFDITQRHFKKNLSEYEVNEIKKKIFCLSMCEKDLEFKEDSLPLWRNYAQDGYGVGIVLNFEKSFAKDWVYTMLSKVYYDKKHLEKFLKVDALYDEFRIKHDLSISNFDKMFYKYFAFHKSKIYKSEKEVRLIYCEGFEQYKNPFIKFDINRQNKKTTYIELDLEWEMPKKIKDEITGMGMQPKNIRPIIKIDKIILGYRLSNNAKWDITDVCSAHLKEFKSKPKIINSTLFDHFKEKESN